MYAFVVGFYEEKKIESNLPEKMLRQNGKVMIKRGKKRQSEWEGIALCNQNTYVLHGIHVRNETRENWEKKINFVSLFNK